MIYDLNHNAIINHNTMINHNTIHVLSNNTTPPDILHSSPLPLLVAVSGCAWKGFWIGESYVHSKIWLIVIFIYTSTEKKRFIAIFGPVSLPLNVNSASFPFLTLPPWNVDWMFDFQSIEYLINWIYWNVDWILLLLD